MRNVPSKPLRRRGIRTNVSIVRQERQRGELADIEELWGVDCWEAERTQEVEPVFGQFFHSGGISVKQFLKPLSKRHVDFSTTLVYAQVKVKGGKNEAKILDVIRRHHFPRVIDA